MTYAEIVEQINQKPMMPTWIPSLEGITKALRLLQLPLEKFRKRSLLVAGTNGKGSVAKTLAHLLESQGFQTHLFTSPHLVNIRERIQTHEKWISEEDFARSYLRVREKLGDLQISHFEILTCIALDSFCKTANEKSWFIYEIGMGGLWDATNAIPHAYSVITTIGLDHQKFLGQTTLEIAKNKFGIIDTNNTVFSGFLPDETFSLLEKTCEEKNATLLRLDEDKSFQEEFFYSVDKNSSPPSFYMEWNDRKYSLALAGERGFENSLLALFILRHLEIPTRAVISHLKTVKWPGRMSPLNVAAPCPVYVSGDHNPEGIASLLEVLNNYQWNKLHILSAISEGRTADSILNPLFSLPRTQIYLTKNPFKPLSLADYEKWQYFSTWTKMKGLFEEDYAKAFDHIRTQAQTGDLILITGSLYLTGAVLEKFNSENSQ